MKTTLLLCAALLPLAVSAQKLQATAPPTTYHVGSEQAPLYHTPADTTKKTGFFLSAGAEATVVGEYSPRWVIVKREGFLYLTPTQRFTDYNSANLEAGRAADAAGLPVDPQTKLITYQGVVEVPGVNKIELYRRAYEWVAKTYRSANDVIQMQDKDAGQLVAKGLIRVYSKSRDVGVVRHTLTIYVKDGRYKHIMTNLAHESSGQLNTYSGGPLEQTEARLYPAGAFGGKKTWADIKQDANRKAYSLAADLKSSMTMQGKKDPSDF